MVTEQFLENLRIGSSIVLWFVLASVMLRFLVHSWHLWTMYPRKLKYAGYLNRELGLTVLDFVKRKSVRIHLLVLLFSAIVFVTISIAYLLASR